MKSNLAPLKIFGLGELPQGLESLELSQLPITELQSQMRKNENNVFLCHLTPDLLASVAEHFSSLPLSPSSKCFVFVTSDMKSIKAHRSLFRDFLNSGLIFFISQNWQLEEIRNFLQKAVEKIHQKIEARQILKWTEEQNQNLKALNKELETSVDSRKKSLKKSLSSLQRQQAQTEAPQKWLLALQHSRSFNEITQALNHYLNPILDLESIRVNLSLSSNLLQKSQELDPSNLFAYPLGSEEENLGTLLFQALSRKKKINATEKNLMWRVAESTTLALRRLNAMTRLETSKAQWEATFDSISKPLCLVDENFLILKANQSFSKKSGVPFRSLMGQHALQIFIGQSQEDRKPHGQEQFQVVKDSEGQQETFEVQVHPLDTQSGDEVTFLILFKDVSEQIQIERQILEASKMADLGLIGGSIAHELNNPLGGVLSFSQLALMSLDESHEAYEDLKAIEKSALKCKTIVRDLLGFARKSDQSMSLREALEQAKNITEIRSRSRGIQIEFQDLTLTPQKGPYSLLVQAFINILQNSVEAIAEKKNLNPRFFGTIKIAMKEEKNEIFIEIKDNGNGIPQENLPKVLTPLFTSKASSGKQGLGLTLANRIVSDLQGRMEISSQTGVGTEVKISLKRPEIGPERRSIDGKI